MNEREIQVDCLKKALASASSEPIKEALRLYDLRAAEPRADSLRAQMMRTSAIGEVDLATKKND